MRTYIKQFIGTLREHRAIAGLMLLMIVVSFLSGFSMYLRSQSHMELQIKDRLSSSTAVAAQQFHGLPLENIQSRDDMNTQLFYELVDRLNAIKKEIPQIRFAYIMRKTHEPTMLEFVADADSLKSTEELDLNGNGEIEEDEEGSYPGDLYDISEVPGLQGSAFLEPTVDHEFTIDQWGSTISGYAPIKDSQGETIAILGLDMEASDFITASRSIFSPLLLFLVLTLGVLMVGLLFFVYWKRQVTLIKRMEDERNALIDLTSHQLGGPLTAIRWWLEIAKDSKESINEQIYNTLSDAAHELYRVVTMLIDMNSVAERKFLYRPEQASLDSVLKGVVDALKPVWERKKQSIALELECICSMKFDPKLIGGAFEELLQNAIDYSPEGSAILVKTECRGLEAVISIIDHGYGVLKNEQKSLFRKMFRGSNAVIHKPTGNGVGLYIAKGIIEKADGRIWFETAEGKGSTFSFSLPI